MLVICLVRGADLYTAQLMLLPLTVSCFSKIQIGFTVLLPAHLGSPGQRAVKWVCVCVLAVTVVVNVLPMLQIQRDAAASSLFLSTHPVRLVVAGQWSKLDHHLPEPDRSGRTVTWTRHWPDLCAIGRASIYHLPRRPAGYRTDTGVREWISDGRREDRPRREVTVSTDCACQQQCQCRGNAHVCCLFKC